MHTTNDIAHGIEALTALQYARSQPWGRNAEACGSYLRGLEIPLTLPSGVVIISREEIPATLASVMSI